MSDRETITPHRPRMPSVRLLPGMAAGNASATDNLPGTPRSSCSGSLVKNFPVTRSTTYGSVKIYVYYSSANGGTQLHHRQEERGQVRQEDVHERVYLATTPVISGSAIRRL